MKRPIRMLLGGDHHHHHHHRHLEGGRHSSMDTACGDLALDRGGPGESSSSPKRFTRAVSHMADGDLEHNKSKTLKNLRRHSSSVFEFPTAATEVEEEGGSKQTELEEEEEEGGAGTGATNSTEVQEDEDERTAVVSGAKASEGGERGNAAMRQISSCGSMTSGGGPRSPRPVIIAPTPPPAPTAGAALTADSGHNAAAASTSTLAAPQASGGGGGGGGGGQHNVVMNCRRDPETVSLQNSSDFVRFNVGGHVFLTRKRNFACFPFSRLGRLMRTKDSRRVLDLCDAFDPGYDDTTLGGKRTIPTYFFDRNGKEFDQILDIYRRGSLHSSGEGAGRCTMTAFQDLEYWGIDEYTFESCCSLKYHQGKELCQREVEAAIREEKLAEEAADEDSFGNSKVERVRRALWNLLEYPESSVLAKVFAVVSFAVIVLSTVTFLVGVFLDDESEISGNKKEDDEEEGFAFRDLLTVVDNVALAFFTVEYLTRLVSAPSFCRFLFSLEGLPDLLAILPFLLSVLVYELQALNIVGKASKLLHLIRIVKVFRVFKLIRHLASLQSLLVTLKQANREIWLLGLVVSIALLMFSTLTYYSERNASSYEENGAGASGGKVAAVRSQGRSDGSPDGSSDGDSDGSGDNRTTEFAFTDSLWYSVMTLTSVGFSGRQPETWMGRASAALSAVFGAFVMTLPIPVVINSFAGYYRNRLVRRVVLTKRARRLGERRRALRFQAIGVFLEEDNAVGALAKGQLGGFVGRRSVNHTAAGDVMI